MNPKSSQLKFQTGSQQVQHHSTHSTQEAGRAFASVEELLRHDSAQNPVPEPVAARLAESLRREPPQKSSWVRRLLGAKWLGA